MWAVWALANLTTVTPEKYCKLVREEGGITLVEEILNQNSEQVETFSKFISVKVGMKVASSVAQVVEWAGRVRSNVLRWEEQPDLGLEFEG